MRSSSALACRHHPSTRPVAAWKHRFAFKCLSVVHEQAFGGKVPRYHAITELDKKVRDFYVPPSLRVPGFGGASLENPHVQPPIELTMQRYIAFAIKEICGYFLNVHHAL